MRLLPVDTAVTVFINATALIDDTDFKTREEAVTYNQAGLDLLWNFETPAGVITQTAVTPTDTAGVYDWTNVGNGMYKIEIPASGGGTINNDTEGYGFFTGFATGILPWTGPTYAFVPAHVVNGLVAGSDNLEVNTVQAAGTAWGSGAITAASIAADAITDAKVASDVTIASVTGSVGSVTGAVGSVTGAVGSVTGNVGGIAGTITTLDGLDTAQDSQHAATQADIAGLNDPTAAAIADAVWDEVLTGGTHNVASSAGRRLRTLQTGGNYEGGMVWVDTVAGAAGTTTDENGVVTNPVLTLADARTIAAAVPLKALHVANGSTITLASATEQFVIEGHEWILALGTQSISGTAVIGANAVTGVSSGTGAEFEDCIIGNGTLGATLPPGTYVRCGFNTGSGFPFTGSAAGKYVFVDCYSHIAVGGASTPFFSFTGASTVMFRRYSGGANIAFDAATGALTYECLTGGNLTVALAGSDLQARGIIRDMTLTGITTDSLVEFVGTIGNLSLAGADGTVTLDGVVGAVVDNRTGTPVLNLPVNTMGIVGNVTGSLSGSVGSLTGHTVQTGDSFARIGAAGAGLTAVAWNAAWDAEVQSEVADALAVYDPPTNTELEARTLVAAGYATAAEQTQTQSDIAGLTDISAAQVNAEIVDALNTDTYAEPGAGAPAATASLAAKINYLYKSWRNRKTQTATTLTVYNDDATTAAQQATVSDDGTTTTIGEIGSA